MSRDSKGRFATPDPFGAAMRARIAQKAGHTPPASQPPGATGPLDDGSSGGFGGGLQAPGVPEGESFNDEVRRRVLGG